MIELAAKERGAYMDKEIKMQSDLRHTQRNAATVVVGMFALLGLFSTVAGFTRHTSKPLFYVSTAATFGVVGLGGIKVARLEKRGKEIARQLDQYRKSKQNG